MHSRPTTRASGRAAWPGDLPDTRAACGMGFVATPGQDPSHRVVALATTALARLAHRGGLDADGKSGDGAGVLIDIPRRLVGDAAVLVLFDWDPRARELVERTFDEGGTPIREWRLVPVELDSLGESARESAPAVWQGLMDRPGVSDDSWEDLLYLARRRAEKMAEARGIRMYIPSCSCRTVVYKGLMAGTHLAEFYPDLGDPATESRVAVFHQRYSTNTAPDWRLAQPFRFLAHNGEINTISGNRNWMRAREAELPDELRPVIFAGGSDSAQLDNVLELLTRRGFSPAEALMTLVPAPWESRGDMAPGVRDFYRYQSTHFEPWDGPAALSFSDGRFAGAALDRNGLRPLRYQVTRGGLVVAASEAGVVVHDPADVIERGRLGPGQLLLVDLRDGRVLRDAEAKAEVADQHDYGLLADRMLVPLSRRQGDRSRVEDAAAVQRMHGWSSEDLKMVVAPMADTGYEPVYSMGDDIPIAPLGRTPRRVYNHLRQRFAQVTNPAIDPLRERAVMSLRVLLGARGATLASARRSSEILGRRVHPAITTEGTSLLELESPVLSTGQAEQVLAAAAVVDATFAVDETLAGAIARICDEAEAAPDGVLALSDHRAGAHRLPVPMVLAVGAVHERLIASGRRMQKDLVAFAGDALDTHDVAMLIGSGASAVHPHLAIDAALASAGDDPEAEVRYRKAIENGLLKVMAKMGISCVSSYCGAQVFEALGLGAEVMQACLPGVPSRIGGAGFADLERDIRVRHAAAWGEPGPLPEYGRVRFRRNGEWHAYNPMAVKALQRASEQGSREEYESFRELSTADRPAALRDLLRIRPAADPIDADAVEPVEAIRTRFIATAMSLGALSPEAHGALSEGVNSVGGRSNSGEGGEDDALYQPGARRLDNKIKQVASGRFGVTPRYLRRADELEIKISQGSKPGEGGQLPGIKVTSLIARLRHAQEGTQLISPPPHHDIYSIEDLAQLIHDLRAANPRARIGVKLVSEAGVGTVAAGVAKAKADYILVSGHDGGTGASPLSSIKNAGTPWELGLAETQQVLVRSRLRERVTLRTDGGLKNGRDIVIAALLGAEEFGFGTALLVALGCDMARQCHLNTCPAGIATQRDDLRAKFTGRPEHVVNYLSFVAEEARTLLASIGARSLDEVIGRVDLLEALPDTGLDLSFLLREPDGGGPRRRTWDRNGDPANPSPPSGSIDNSVRTAGADLRSESRAYSGSSGQSFGAWLDDGSELTLQGEANDYVGKGMGGGVISIQPPPGDSAVDPVLAGNTCLYGATGGSLFVAGRAGERFAIRNSGASAVVEGAGDHFCEYMTGGTVVSLGPIGANAGAGMTGGTAYIREHGLLNEESVAARPVPADDADTLRAMVEEHARRTGSPLAIALLGDWEKALAGFRQVVPVSVYERDAAAPAVMTAFPAPADVTAPR